MPAVRQAWARWWWPRDLCTAPLCPACCLLSRLGHDSKVPPFRPQHLSLFLPWLYYHLILFYFLQSARQLMGSGWLICESLPARTLSVSLPPLYPQSLAQCLAPGTSSGFLNVCCLSEWKTFWGPQIQSGWGPRSPGRTVQSPVWLWWPHLCERVPESPISLVIEK